MKKIFALLLVLTMVLSFAACSNDNTQPTEPNHTTGTEAPTDPTQAPADEPTVAPTAAPTENPTAEPTTMPTQPEATDQKEYIYCIHCGEKLIASANFCSSCGMPTNADAITPTIAPTETPTAAPTEKPTEAPTEKPTEAPTEKPTVPPTQAPTACSHAWKEATCDAPKTCTKCGLTEGKAADHKWEAATCTTPKTCSVCKETKGDAAGHKWEEATCTTPKTCSSCGKTKGDVAKHTWVEATCQAPKTCSACEKTKGETVDHTFDKEGKCKYCKQVLPVSPTKFKTGRYCKMVLNPDYTGILPVDIDLDCIGLNFTEEGGGMGCSSYQESSKCTYHEKDHLNTLQYNGKEYCQYTGRGDPLEYEINDDYVVISCPFTAELEVLSDGTLRVVSIEKDNGYGILVGDIFE